MPIVTPYPLTSGGQQAANPIYDLTDFTYLVNRSQNTLMDNMNVIERAGSRVHYWLSGSADHPLIVLTHGAMLDHGMFDAQLPVLREQFRVLTWDVRGHGLSQPLGTEFSLKAAADDLLAILDAVGVEKAIFVGHSMGGNLTQELVFYHPERVQALVMVDCICNTLPLTWWERTLLGMTVPLLKLYPYSALKRQTIQANALQPQSRAYIAQAIEQVSRQAFYDIWAAVARAPHAEPDYRIAQPLLLVRGEHDHQGSIPTSMAAWAQRDPNTRYAIIPDAGHCSNLDNPDSFNRVLLEFVCEHRPKEMYGSTQ